MRRPRVRVSASRYTYRNNRECFDVDHGARRRCRIRATRSGSPCAIRGDGVGMRWPGMCMRPATGYCMRMRWSSMGMCTATGNRVRVRRSSVRVRSATGNRMGV